MKYPTKRRLRLLGLVTLHFLAISIAVGLTFYACLMIFSAGFEAGRKDLDGEVELWKDAYSKKEREFNELRASIKSIQAKRSSELLRNSKGGADKKDGEDSSNVGKR